MKRRSHIILVASLIAILGALLILSRLNFSENDTASANDTAVERSAVMRLELLRWGKGDEAYHLAINGEIVAKGDAIPAYKNRLKLAIEPYEHIVVFYSWQFSSLYGDIIYEAIDKINKEGGRSFYYVNLYNINHGGSKRDILREIQIVEYSQEREGFICNNRYYKYARDVASDAKKTNSTKILLVGDKNELLNLRFAGDFLKEGVTLVVATDEPIMYDTTFSGDDPGHDPFAPENK
jgi:hypothetical protein